VEQTSALWSHLRQVRLLRFVARSGAATSWDGIGTGSVVVETPSDASLIFREAGMWQPERGQESRFTNVFRWSLVRPDLIRLEHLRFGPDRPVFLFEIGPVADGRWQSVRPHF
jgi:hypothetical protein